MKRDKLLGSYSQSWPQGGADDVLEYLQERYFPSLLNIDLSGLLTDPILGRTALVSSFGTQSAVLLHYVTQLRPSIPVIFLDTHKHFSETLEYRDQLTELLSLNLLVVRPDTSLLQEEDPRNTLSQEDPNTCCMIRKTFPLQDTLDHFDSWISGRKRFQSISRSTLPILERDGTKLKINPLAIWTESEVEQYSQKFNLPRHPLQSYGYPSIGCEPCTEKVMSGGNSRNGRWSKFPEKTECGIHLSPDGRFVRPVRNLSSASGDSDFRKSRPK